VTRSHHGGLKGRPDRLDETLYRCAQHLRAWAAIAMANDYIGKIVDEPGLDPASLSAFHSAAVVAYSRAFTEARSRRGKISYQTRPLRRSTPGFDKALHEHLLELRNTLVAHSDYTALPPTLDFEIVGELMVSVGANVKTLAGIESRALAERYRAHFHACISGIRLLLDAELRELASQAKASPDALAGTRGSENIPLPPMRSGVFYETSLGRAVREPTFASALSGYAYTTLRYAVPLLPSGRYTVRDLDGSEHELEIEVTPRSHPTLSPLQAPNPVLKAMLLCDRVERDPHSGKIALHGLFDTITPSQFPREIKNLCVYVRIAGGEGDYEIELQIVNLVDDHVLASLKHPEINIPSRFRHHELNLTIHSLTVTGPIRMELRFLANGRLLGTAPFAVSGTPEPAAPSAEP
jgi:hypothetical protein